MTPFSNELEAKFQELMQRYPARRSALVPMLIYGQDELGYLPPAAIARIAELLDESEMAVREVIGYYSMLRLQPAGKYHVQVCTNISCLLRGGDELMEHCQHRLGIGNRETTTDGVFSLEEVECIGACSWAPAVQVNYDFHQELTPERLDQILDAYQQRALAGERAGERA